MDRFLKGSWDMGITLDNFTKGKFSGSLHDKRTEKYAIPQTKIGKIVSNLREKENMHELTKIFALIEREQNMRNFVGQNDYIIPLPSDKTNEYSSSHYMAKTIGATYNMKYIDNLFIKKTKIEKMKVYSIEGKDLSPENSKKYKLTYKNKYNHNSSTRETYDMVDIDELTFIPQFEYNKDFNLNLDHKKILIFNDVFYNEIEFNILNDLLKEMYKNVKVNIFTITKSRRREFSGVWVGNSCFYNVKLTK